MMNNNQLVFVAACVGIIGLGSLVQTLPSAAIPAIKLTSFPRTGKVLSLTNGDLMCYIDIDVRGKTHHLGADFSICTQTKFINKQVQLTYKNIKVNDCQSSEPCGKTRTENLIVKMKLIQIK